MEKLKSGETNRITLFLCSSKKGNFSDKGGAVHPLSYATIYVKLLFCK